MKNINRGFSLVEVAIAIVVISVITTFSLKGKNLIQIAKLRATMEQVETFRIAVNSFTDKYGALPGDFTNATEMIDSSLKNGEGTGMIRSTEDAKRFWQHLSKSGLIAAEMTNGFPTSKVGGFFSVSSSIQGKPGVWLILSKGTTDNIAFSGALTPSDAHYIDKNMDTGFPNEGDIQVLQAKDVYERYDENQNYNFKNKSESCVVLFRL